MRLTAVTIFAGLGLAATPVLALDMSGMRCDDPDMIKIMEEQVAKTPVEGGGFASSFVGHITKAVTRQASTNKLICDITMAGSGGIGPIRLTMIYTQFSGGRLKLDITSR